MAKELKTMDEIIIMLNAAMAESDALDGDCKGCKVRGLYKLKDQKDIDRLGRNWEAGRPELINLPELSHAMDQIVFFNTDSNTYNCQYCPTTNRVQVTVSIPGAIGSKIEIFQAPAQTDIEALGKVTDTISTGTLR